MYSPIRFLKISCFCYDLKYSGHRKQPFHSVITVYDKCLSASVIDITKPPGYKSNSGAVHHICVLKVKDHITNPGIRKSIFRFFYQSGCTIIVYFLRKFDQYSIPNLFILLPLSLLFSYMYFCIYITV